MAPVTTVCTLCKSLLVRPDEPIPEIRPSRETADMTLGVESNMPTIVTSAENGCCICRIFLLFPQNDLTPMAARLEQYMDDCSICSYYKTDPDHWLLRQRIPLHPRLQSSEIPAVITDPMSDVFHRSSVSVTPVSSTIASGSTADEKCMDRIRSWLDTCIKDHSLCHRKTDAQHNLQPPTRLIDISGDDGPRLVTTEGSAAYAEVKYATLSHRWSMVPHTKLLQGNMEQLCRRIDMGSMPLVFQDAVAVAKRLQIRYVWIDCLCIVQDSRADWEKEASRMGQVYQNAFCNLGATAAADDQLSHDELSHNQPPGALIGLFAKRDPHSVFPVAVEVVRKDSPQKDFFAYTNEMVGPLDKSLLMGRGWVFQERLLSQRSIYFGSQLTWECCERLACEAFPDGVPGQKVLNAFDEGMPQRITTILLGFGPNRLGISESSAFVYRNWLKLVQKYSKCKLTYETDRLPALSGLAEAFAGHLRDEYIAGVWRKDLLASLLWRTSRPSAVPVEYIAPSWSWASSGHVYFASLHGLPLDFLCEVEDTKVTLCGPDPMGMISRAYITLTGHMKESHVRMGQDEFPSFMNHCADWYDTNKIQEELGLRGATFHFVVAHDAEDRRLLGLILQPTEMQDQFRRVGIFARPYRHEDGFVGRHKYMGYVPVRQEDFPEFAHFDPDNFERSTVTII